MSWLWLLVLLAPGIFIIPFTLAGLVMLPVYGVDKIRWHKGAIEVVAKTNKAGKTRIWGSPVAQTLGFFIYYAREKTIVEHGRTRGGWDDRALRVHERVHILQPLIFGVFYVLVYGGSFGILYLLALAGAWKSEKGSAYLRAYRRIPFEAWAFSKEDKFKRGELASAWGA